RPFDVRQLYYRQGFTSRPAFDVMRHMIGVGNLALLTCRQQAEPGFHHAFVTNLISECCAVSLKTREKTSVFPLWVFEAPSDGLTLRSKRSNIDESFLVGLARAIGSTAKPSPLDAFLYVYAVLHSPAYRARYEAFLRIDFPRIPLPHSVDLFESLVA